MCNLCVFNIYTFILYKYPFPIFPIPVFPSIQPRSNSYLISMTVQWPSSDRPMTVRWPSDETPVFLLSYFGVTMVPIRSTQIEYLLYNCIRNVSPSKKISHQIESLNHRLTVKFIGFLLSIGLSRYLPFLFLFPSNQNALILNDRSWLLHGWIDR